MNQKPEIMSPAGHWPQLHAAIEAGADSIYFGLKHFSARAKVGFEQSELPAVMKTLHRRGVRGYVTFNTLIFEHELEQAAHTIALIAQAGADALIVQDLAVLKLAQRIAPSLELHASTQMSVTDARGVELARELGVSRVTLARELSLEEVKTISERTQFDLEIFVHGALCVAYSGQCYSSEAWGGRSANRGQCAQACRLPYEMVVDGAVKPLGDARYLLSPGDLYTLRQVPEIVAAGVSAMKIEGRYKDAEYVAITTDAYRRAVDSAWAGRAAEIAREDELRIEQVYSRGLGPFFATGTNHQVVVEGRAPRHRGVRMGRVARVGQGSVTIVPSDADAVAPLKPGDGVVFDAASWRSPQEPEEGGSVFEVTRTGDELELRFGNRSIDFARIRVGDWVWRSADADTAKAARAWTQATVPVARQPVSVHASGREGEPLRLEWRCGGHTATVQSANVLTAAVANPLTRETLIEQLGRLGGTAYRLHDLAWDVEGPVFLPVSALNRMRRDAIERLTALQETSGHETREPRRILSTIRHSSTEPEMGPAVIHLLVRTPEQLEAAIALRPSSVTLDYLDLYGLRPSVERVKSAGLVARVASPRVLKPSEERIAHFLLSLDCPVLVRPASLLAALTGRELIGDFSLNVTNAIAAEEFLSRGIERITPGHDLNAEQIGALAGTIGAHRIEAIAYQHLPVFHTEHCVFCRFLSTGTSYKDCGRPCEKHRVELRDERGRSHPVMADVGCRNTVFGAEAQVAVEHLHAWRDAGIRHFRLEFAHESAAEVVAVTRGFDRFLSGATSADSLMHELRKVTPQGTTQGSLFVAPNYRTLPVLQ